MAGTELLELLIQNSGLPEQYVRSRMDFLMKQNGLTAETLDLDKVRELISDLLLDLINESLAEQA
jgi:hypothetical protein